MLLALAFMLAGPAHDAVAKQKQKPLKIDVLSTRADLVSDGQALVAIRGTKTLRGLKVTVAGKSQKKNFKLVKGTPRGLVKGLRRGSSAVVVRQGARGARLQVTNHPIGGPVFAGPQLKPWTCRNETATDDQCDQAPTFRYLYMPTGGSGLQAYDPGNPPSDVATTTTDQGVEVPFVVREETGYIDRDQYQIATLFQPGQTWTPVKPQKQFNGKVLVTHGFGCGVEYQTAGAPSVVQGTAALALGRGFAVMSNALDNASHNCNLAVEAESLLMTKEHLIDSYGPVRYTIGTGCSGGSLAIQTISNAYPGIYQGIVANCSFPDAWSTATQFHDYHLSLDYFLKPARWGAGVTWTPEQMAAVQGHVSILNSQVSDGAQFHVVIPNDPCGGVAAEIRYSLANPGGVRCSIADATINLLGPRAKAQWTSEEKQVGHGFAGLPIDNIGVQYGLGALQKGQITPAQFVDLNLKMGGIDKANTTVVSTRTTADRPALANAYRTGLINETNNLDQTAIIDCRGPDEGMFHDAYRAFAVRARLDREHGGHGNQLIWEGSVPLSADAKCEDNGFLAMDRWIQAIKKDDSSKALAKKIVKDKPKDLTDRCYDGNGGKVADELCGPSVVHVYGTPRTVAGDEITTDTNKCRLKPIDRSADYGPVSFTDQEWNQLKTVFPSGVCDFSKPGVDQQKTISWQTYQAKNGKVIYGGKPLGPAPKSKSFTKKKRGKKKHRSKKHR